MDRDLSASGEYKRAGDVKYILGKRFKRRGRFAEAYEAFVDSERWLIEEKGVDHPYVVAAIIMQAHCQARLGNTSMACDQYRRALARMVELGYAGHPTATAISEWVRNRCR